MNKFSETKTYRQAKKENPWAVKIAKVVGGYRCFRYLTDYEIWKKQK